MHYDPESRAWPPRQPRAPRSGRHGYDLPYGGRAPEHGWAAGYRGGALRSRGSFEAEPWAEADEERFAWGGGYIGGRGYGGTNRDYEVGYRTSARPTNPVRGAGAGEDWLPRDFARAGEFDRGAGPGAAIEPGTGWDSVHEYRPEWGAGEDYGPARYGYGPYYERLQRRRRDDGDIRQDVEDALFYDTWVDADAIAVEVAEGIVTLQGTLPSYEEVRYATDDAWDVDGVRGVRARLAVGSPDEAQRDEEESRAPENADRSGAGAGGEGES